MKSHSKTESASVGQPNQVWNEIYFTIKSKKSFLKIEFLIKILIWKSTLNSWRITQNRVIWVGKSESKTFSESSLNWNITQNWVWIEKSLKIEFELKSLKIESELEIHLKSLKSSLNKKIHSNLKGHSNSSTYLKITKNWARIESALKVES